MKTNEVPETRLGRLRFLADNLGVPAPTDLREDLLDSDGGPSVAVCKFCDETGASLDFIYFGVSPMLRG